ncbi:hypothetical protein SDC9_116726 [bioreactor metagenome]|uniref:Uncharacterized protein n=1 Tax=bioreactor metagenome TaxID=1076179 RepID=A0A645BXE6_9ZZZZ
MMEAPYMAASEMAFLRTFLFLFRKKLTVMGIIGQTQGVSSAAKPQINPFRKILHSDELPSCCEPNEFNSSVTGAQSSSLSAATGAGDDTESRERFSTGTVAASGVPDPASRVDAATVIIFGRFVELKENSLGSGGVQLWSSQA